MRKIYFLLFVTWSILLLLTIRAFSEMDILQATTIFYTDGGWRAQFNFDFQVYLILAALWIFYREKTPIVSHYQHCLRQY